MKNQPSAKFSMKRAVFALAISVLSIAGCTKSKETHSLVKPDAFVAKADYEGKVFSLVRGIEEADSNNVVGAIPGMSDDYGFVKVRITENEVQFIEVFNPENKTETQSVLASFKILDHFDIQREVNDYRETTHKIIEFKERPWQQRQFMRVDWSSPTNEKSALASLTSAPEAKLENVVLVSDPKNENGHISWMTEFSVPGGSGWWGVAPSSRVMARTHLMPVKETDFEKLNYREQDFKRFGYFFTQQRFEDPERGLLDSTLENNTFAEIFNVCEPGRKDQSGKALSCSTGKIVWHPSKNFPPKYLAATRNAVQEWNKVFQEALGRTDDVVVFNETEVDLVDPRFNVIGHYGAKSPGGLLGVAQGSVNPMTGEKIGARATVYEDGIRYMLGLVDDVVTLILQDDETRKMFLATDEETKARIEQIFKKSGNFKVKDDIMNLRATLGLSISDKNKKAPSARRTSTAGNSLVQDNIPQLLKRVTSEPAGRAIERKAELMRKDPGLFAVSEAPRLSGGRIADYNEAFGLLGNKRIQAGRLPALPAGIESLHDVSLVMKEEKARLINQAMTGVHGAELVEEATLRYIMKTLAKHPEAADFKAQVAALKSEVEQSVYYSTLLHEMGHTFGLRHNFQASADAKHYHPKFHELSKQMEAESALPPEKRTVTQADLEPYMYSSIMDYGAEFYSQEGGLGPYDKAAIRYAYNRSIDKKNDATVLGRYAFCTDHEANESVLCRRFDKGRNVSEITFNAIENYHTNWLLSHYRRDRANFERRARAMPQNALIYSFIPIRQVMDEFVFALIDARQIPAKQNECGMEFWKRSVDRGEIINVCNPLEAERNGVDPTDLETFEIGLMGPNGLRKNPTTFEPNGLADLLFANMLAKKFFTDILGSPLPGRYIAIPDQQQQFTLEKLPDSGDLDAALTELAGSMGIQATPEVIGQMKGLVGEIKPGRYAKPFNSEWDESGPVPRQLNIGSFWDKYVAMLALGFQDIGVRRYERRSLVGNAYAYPHTKQFAQNTIAALITQDRMMSTIPFKTASGVVPVLAPPALNLDVQAVATITALTDFVSLQDVSIADKLRVCSTNEQGCRGDESRPVVEFRTASGQDVYRSAQTSTQDSIAFELMSAASKIDQERKTWEDKIRTVANTQADVLMKFDALKGQRESLEKTLAALNIPDVTNNLQVFLGADPAKPSVWNIVGMLATQGDKIPLFASQNLVQQVGNVLNGMAQVLGGSIVALDPENKCPIPQEPGNAPANGAAANGNAANDPGARGGPPAVVGLNNLLRGRMRAGPAAANMARRLAGNASNLSPNSPLAGEAAPAANANVDCAKVNESRAVLIAAGKEFQTFAKGMSDVVMGVVDTKVAPLRVKRLTDELERSEATIRFIRRVSSATGKD